jgi:hypothetical protein
MSKLFFLLSPKTIPKTGVKTMPKKTQKEGLTGLRNFEIMQFICLFCI